MSTSAPFTVASFFSGIGGLDLGFERAGSEVVSQCEIDTFCNAILQKQWPNVLRFRDVKKIQDPRTIPAADVWIGGFPCQDVSLARMGPRAGLRGSRSGLFNDFARLLAEVRPKVFVIENVPGLLSSHGGRDFGIVLRTLAGIGYGVAWRMLNSRYFAVPQSRQRIYLVGCYRDDVGAGEILFEPECGEGNASQGKPNGSTPISPFKEVLGDTRKGPVYQRIAYCLYACSARHTGTDWSRTYVTYPDGAVRRLTPRECEGIQGFPVDWTLPEEPAYDIDKLDSLRYYALGNAVTVPVAQWLAQRIRSYLGGRECVDEPSIATPAQPRSVDPRTRAAANGHGATVVALPESRRRHAAM